MRLFTRTRRVRSLARNSSTWCTTVTLLMSTQWLCTVTNCNILNDFTKTTTSIHKNNKKYLTLWRDYKIGLLVHKIHSKWDKWKITWKWGSCVNFKRNVLLYTILVLSTTIMNKPRLPACDTADCVLTRLSGAWCVPGQGLVQDSWWLPSVLVLPSLHCLCLWLQSDGGTQQTPPQDRHIPPAHVRSCNNFRVSDKGLRIVVVKWCRSMYTTRKTIFS